MRFIPLIPSSSGPEIWAGFRDVELRWESCPHSGWEAAAQRGVGIHALHFQALPWGNALLEAALEASRHRLGADFLVLPAMVPSGRMATSTFLQTLEALLEHTSGRGVKLALRPEPGAVPALITLLKEVRAEAVGFCWDAQVGGDLDLIADRVYTAVGMEGADYSALQRTGYRWNLALEGELGALQRRIESLEEQFPGVLFPAVMPATALGRPVLPDDSLRFGSHWGEAREEGGR